jgi:hypothetical protein
MNTVTAINVAMAAIKTAVTPMPDGDQETALRVLRSTRRGEVEKQEAAAFASLT